MKAQCTTGRERRVTRWEHEAIFAYRISGVSSPKIVVCDEVNEICYAIQLYESRSIYADPPCFIDRKFVTAFADAVHCVGISRVRDNQSLVPYSKDLARIAKKLRLDARKRRRVDVG
jgi:hypothetical protein